MTSGGPCKPQPACESSQPEKEGGKGCTLTVRHAVSQQLAEVLQAREEQGGICSHRPVFGRGMAKA